MQVDTHKLDALIRAKTDPEPYSGVVLLSRGDERLFSGAYGLALRGDEIPNQMDTRFQVASASKAFTAVAILKLVEQGKLSLDTPLLDAVPEPSRFPHYTRDIKIQHVLTHTLGISCYLQLETEAEYLAQLRAHPADTLRQPSDYLPMFAEKPTRFAPGERFEYNNAAYVLAALVVETISGMPFVDFVTQSVLVPAGMVDSGYFETDRLPGQVARSYVIDEDGRWRTNVFMIPVIGGGDGGAYCTARDLRRFWRALRSGDILGPQLARQMLAPQVRTTQPSPHSAYGMGVWLDAQCDGVHRAFVEGGDPGMAMHSSMYGRAGTAWSDTVTLTMLANTSSALWSLAQELENILSLS